VIPPTARWRKSRRWRFCRRCSETNWNKQEAAQILGLYRPTLYSKMKKHEIRDAGKSARNSAASPSTPTPAAT
jgi:DNA-binding NtrC family response regulator